MVTYVVNRNINFTNVCIKRCGFCAFSRDHREDREYPIRVKCATLAWHTLRAALNQTDAIARTE